MIVFNYGGGRQTIAMVIMIARDVLPVPDRCIIADTSYENPMTWEYLDKYVQPLMTQMGCRVEIVPHSFATVATIYALNGDMILPAWTTDGKLKGFCSNEWKARVCDRYLRSQGITGGERWLGLAHDERRRWISKHNAVQGQWTIRCPLVDKMMNTQACLSVIESFGWPQPQTSSCHFCPHKHNSQWRYLQQHHPKEFEDACKLDEEIRTHDTRGGAERGGKLYLHHSRTPLREADLTAPDPVADRQCSLGVCFV